MRRMSAEQGFFIRVHPPSFVAAFLGFNHSGQIFPVDDIEQSL
jgi:hypothetical protein